MDLPRGLQVKQRQQLGESDLLLSLYRSLIENADLASGLRSALEIVCQFAGWAVGTAWLPGEDGSRLEFVAGWQVDDPKLSEFIFACANQKFQPNFGMVGRVWEKRNPEWTRNLAAEPRELFPFAPLAIHAGLSAALCVPIARGNEINGVLTFHAREVKDEDDRLVQIVSRVATQLGFALHQRQTEQELRRQETRVRRGNEELDRAVLERTSSLMEATELLQAEVAARTQVQDRLEQRVRQQAAAAEIGRRALQGIELSGLLGQTAALVTQTLGVEFCKILELSPDKQTLLLRAGAGWKEGCVGVATVSAGAKSQAGYTLLSKTPIIVEDLKTETRFSGAPLLADHNVASGLSVIIGHQDRPYGVLGAHTTALRAFTKDDIHFLEAVATMLFQVIEHDNDMKQIRRSASWLERLIHTIQDAVVSIDRRGCIVLFNAAAERVFGYSASEIVGRKVNDLMAEPYATEHDDYLARYERTGEPRAIGRIRTVEGRRKSGEIFPLELSVTQVATSDDEEVHYAAFIRDISEVRRSQAWLQSLIETTQDAVLSIDRQGRVVLFNPAAEAIFGYTRDEIVGQKVNLLMAEPYATEHDGYIERYERTGEARAIGRIRTVMAQRKNGESFPIELSVTEIEVDQHVHYAAFIRDISEKNRLQTQLAESERLVTIGITAAKIGHELANPLNGMSLTVQLLEQRLLRQPGAAEGQILSTVKRLKDEIGRLNKLVGQFATISRREKYVFRPANLAELIDDVVKMQEPHFAQLGIELTRSIVADLPSVNIDADKLKQAVLNLLKNSGEATPHGGKISINAFAAADTVIIEVADTGTGIALDIDAFEPFVTTKKEGTGIGLVVVRQILTAHGGKISYRSQPGQGTTFRIELPRA